MYKTLCQVLLGTEKGTMQSSIEAFLTKKFPHWICPSFTNSYAAPMKCLNLIDTSYIYMEIMNN